jgi:TonB-linked SusC/RagA family outer membrane protein
VIDGVVIEGGINNLVLQDIQDITVLKDAAATAIYGARGANGVIVISTKSGKTGKLKVTYNGYVGTKRLTKTLDVLDPYNFVMYQYDRAVSLNDVSNFYSRYGSTYDTLVNYKNAPLADWQGEVLGQNGFVTQNNISFSGGSKKTTYLFSYTHQKEDAIVLNSSFLKHQFNLKLEHKFTKKMKVGLSARYTNQNVFGAGTSNDGGSVSFNRLRNVIKFRPYLKPSEDYGDADPDAQAGSGLGLINPVKLAQQEFRNKTTNAYNFTFSFNYNITKKLSFRSTAGLDRNLLEDRSFNDSLSPVTSNFSRMPVLGFDSSRKTTFSNSNVLTYSLKNYKQHHDIDILLGQETNYIENNYNVNLYQLKNNTNRDSAFSNINNLGNQVSSIYPQRNTYKATILSFFARANYTLNKKYIFSFVVRADGSSKFADDNRWGYFPSSSFAWRLSDEKFMENFKPVNDIKLRLTYGQNGNARIDDYLYLNTFRRDQLYYGLGGNPVNGYNPNSLGNQNLVWESVINRNLGLDFTMFKKRVDISVDYYYNTSKNLLLNVPIASTYGYNTQFQNIGKTKSYGLEFQMNAIIVQSKKDFNWSANFNIAFNRNEILELRKDMNEFLPIEGSWNITGSRDYIERVGNPVGAFYGFVTDGFYKPSDFVSYTGYNSTVAGYKQYDEVVKGVPTIAGTSVANNLKPGNVRFRDINNDGSISLDSDRTIIGNPNPKFTGGLNQQFSYKGFDASIFINFSYGGQIYNANRIDFTSGYVANANLLNDMQNRFRITDENGVFVSDLAKLEALNKNANIWLPSTASSSYQLHSWAIEDGSFIRINNISFGYSLPVKALAKLHISRLRVYVTGNNLALFTNYSGYDPEVSVRKSPLTQGLDYSAYPKSRSFIFGVNVTF